MNEQGIAWMVAGGHHDPSPEELRYRDHRKALVASRPPRPALRDRIAALIAGQLLTERTNTLALDCCVA